MNARERSRTDEREPDIPFNEYLGEFYDRLLLAAVIRTLYRADPRFTTMLHLVKVVNGKVISDGEGNAIPIDTRQKWENGSLNPDYMRPINVDEVLKTIEDLRTRHKEIFGREYD